MNTGKKGTYKRVRNMQFTWNNYRPEDVKRLTSIASKDFANMRIKYICFGYEICPDTGTPHLQGYVQWTEGISKIQACKRFEPVLTYKNERKELKHRIRFEVASKNKQANRTYCSPNKTSDPKYVDDENEPIFFEWPEAEDDVSGWDEKLETLIDDPNLLAFARKNPQLAFKYSTGIKAIIDATEVEIDDLNAASVYPPNLRLFNWQRWAVDIIKNNEPEGRRIVWFMGTKGKNGKSILAAWLYVNMGALYLNNSKKSNMVYAYKNHPIVCIDICKTSEEFVNYDALESLKGGAMFSDKYAPKSKIGIRPWVFVFSNFKPQRSKMAKERFIVVDLERLKGGMEPENDPHGTLVTFAVNDTYNVWKNSNFAGAIIGSSESCDSD